MSEILLAQNLIVILSKHKTSGEKVQIVCEFNSFLGASRHSSCIRLCVKAAALMEASGENRELYGSDQADPCGAAAAVNPGQKLSPQSSPRCFRKQVVNKQPRRYRRFTVANAW